MKLPEKFLHVAYALLNRGGGMVLQFASVWLIAKAIGVAGVGLYSFYAAWMTVLAAFAGYGSATYTVRVVSVLAKDKDYNAIRGYVRKMTFLLVGSGVVLTLLIALIGPFILGLLTDKKELSTQLVWASAGASVFMWLRLLSETLKSLARINTAMIIETMFVPGVLILVCGWVLLTGSTLSIEWLISIHIIVLILAVLMMLFVVWRATKSSNSDSSNAQHNLPLLNRSMLPLWGSSLLGMLFLNMPLLLLPSFASEEEMGLFAIAYRFINICVNLLMVVGAVYGPRFAREFSDRDFQALRKSLSQTRLLSFIMYVPLFIVFMLVPDLVMGLFGETFKQGGALLMVMALGQLVYASTGLVGTMLNMMHQEAIEFWITLSCTLLMAALIIGFGSYFAVLGVAIGFGLGLGVKNIVSWIAVRRCLRDVTLAK